MTSLVPEPARPFRLWPFVIVNALAAVWLSLSTFQQEQTSDSMIFVLASLYEWRTFFWEQDRVGMFVPLVVSWCKSPFHNLLLQTGIMAFAGLMLPIMLARVLTTNRFAPIAVTIANALFISFAPCILHENWMLVCNYPNALVLGLLALSVVDVRPTTETWKKRALRMATCGALILLAEWQYYGMVLFLGPLIVFRTIMKSGPGAPTRRHGWWRFLFRPLFDPRSLAAVPLLFAALGTIWYVMLEMKELHPIIAPTSTVSLPMDKWCETWELMIRTTAELPEMDRYAAWLGGISGVGLLLGLFVNRRLAWQMLGAMLPGLLAAAVELLFLGTRWWTTQNSCHPRYLLATTTMVATATAIIGLVPVLSRIPRRFEPLAVIVAALCLFGAIAERYGRPSPAIVRNILNENCGTLTPVILESKCEAVGAEYWVVWMSMFHVNMTLYERGEDRVVFGVGPRAEPMKPRWNQYPEGFRVAVPADDFLTVQSGAIYRELVPLQKIEDRGVFEFPGHHHALPRKMAVGIYKTRSKN